MDRHHRDAARIGEPVQPGDGRDVDLLHVPRLLRPPHFRQRVDDDQARRRHRVAPVGEIAKPALGEMAPRLTSTSRSAEGARTDASRRSTRRCSRRGLSSRRGRGPSPCAGCQAPDRAAPAGNRKATSSASDDFPARGLPARMVTPAAMNPGRTKGTGSNVRAARSGAAG